MTGGEILGVTAVGVLAGLDLVSVPQAMTARPLVAGFVGGWLMGHPAVGLVVGVLLELFALETLPVGAARSGGQRGLEPGVLGTGVIGHQIHRDPDTAGVRLAEQ